MLLIVFLINSLLTLKINVMVKLPSLSFRTTFTCFWMCVCVYFTAWCPLCVDRWWPVTALHWLGWMCPFCITPSRVIPSPDRTACTYKYVLFRHRQAHTYTHIIMLIPILKIVSEKPFCIVLCKFLFTSHRFPHKSS